MKLRAAIYLTAPLLLAVAACQPVVGDQNDNSPPAIRFLIGNQALVGDYALDALPPKGVTVLATDPGGMTTLDVTIIVVYDCVAVGRREVQSAQLIDIPPTKYSSQSHSYHSPTFGEFWPDTDADHIKDPSEWHLRFDQLMQPVDREYFQSSNGISSSPCTMSDHSAGAAIVQYILVEPYAVNFRGSILPSDATTTYDELILTVS